MTFTYNPTSLFAAKQALGAAVLGSNPQTSAAFMEDLNTVDRILDTILHFGGSMADINPTNPSSNLTLIHEYLIKPNSNGAVLNSLLRAITQAYGTESFRRSLLSPEDARIVPALPPLYTYLNPQNSCGTGTLLHYAVSSGSVHSTEILLRHLCAAQAPVSCILRENTGTKQTPYHLASILGTRIMCDLFVQYNLDVHTPDFKGHTPRYYQRLRAQEQSFVSGVIAGGGDLRSQGRVR